MVTQAADRIRVMWCQSCDAYHVLLYRTGDELPFAMCTLEPDTMCDIIDADFGVLLEHEHPAPVKMVH